MLLSPTESNSAQNQTPLSEEMNPEISILDLPEEIYREIFSQLGLNFYDLGDIRQVSTKHKSFIDAYCRQFIQKYFPSLMTKDTYKHNPLGLIYQEINYYKEQYPNIELSHILSALIGDNEQFKLLNYQTRITLYAISLAKGFRLKDVQNPDQKFYQDVNELVYIAAAGNGSLDLIKKHTTPISLEMACKALAHACLRGHIHIVNFFLAAAKHLEQKYGKNMLESLDIGNALKNAASGGHIDIINLLINLEELKEINLIDSTLAATKKGHLAIVELLLPKLSTKSVLDKIVILNAALENGHHLVAKYLYEHIRNEIESNNNREPCSSNNTKLSLPEQTLSVFLQEGLKTAAKNGHCKTVEFILLKKQFSAEQLETPIHDAIENGHFRVVETLLPHCQLSKTMLYGAVKSGNIKMLQFIANKFGVDSETVDSAFTGSPKNEHETYVTLSKLRALSFEDFLIITIQKDHMTILKANIENSKRNAVDMNKLVIHAVKSNNTTALSIILEHYKPLISSELRISDQPFGWSIL